MLHEFLKANAEVITARARATMAARTVPVPTAEALKNGVPLFLGQLIDRLRAAPDRKAIEESATRHGGEMLAMGFTVGQVVRGYGDICQVITALAEETGAPIAIDEFRMLNRCLDEAIAHAVSEYERQRDEAAAADEGTETRGELAHELRNRLSAAMLSYGILRGGTVAIGGSTGAVLGRNLRAMQTLINNSLVGEVGVEAAMGAEVAGLGLAVAPVAQGIDVEADQEVLSAAIENLLQNAFKFTRPRGLVSLRATAAGGRVLIEVEDECGGLPPGAAQGLFRPYEQRGADQTGLGLGLSISRKGVEAMGGTLGVRDLPGKGCVFSIDLPRLPAA